MAPDSNCDGGLETTTDRTVDERAGRVVVSYPADLSKWGRFQVEKPSFRAFLCKTREEAVEGDRWEEFVGVGCCGNTLDVPLRVERVEGGPRIAEDTEIAYEVRDACGLEGSWRVQSQGGPGRA
ncbi:hypothetical protein [Natronobacterium gregoryi]|uniref:DUF7968 domain-containing protein n=2 Tax=Natronobacterium gregoryi TaxID=44930 RepID=L0AEB7_NATGS|nr:hypothetical protein [Natronobacterium gregoryi]AFZ72248.1 hypothetical protein Natgr_1017 [Natronobacterium gregoryi SP2]ELY62352.1 hypothetical protein C490_18383 [Natronobacterium gregoryi SP2]PLK20195.1 hypothetical protein CYV19_10910 [Natronobacterium gregoryi SP2]SFJ28893.1 hypothetical protein SAMN05443661_12046 [Natronobacterium gregoryi]